jgi:hypothetical protein
MKVDCMFLIELVELKPPYSKKVLTGLSSSGGLKVKTYP